MKPDDIPEDVWEAAAKAMGSPDVYISRHVYPAVRLLISRATMTERAARPTCQTCQFWGLGAETDWLGEMTGMRRCAGVRERWDIEDGVSPRSVRYEDSDAWDAERAKAISAAMAYVSDGSDYRAELTTHPDFSCKLHTAIRQPREGNGG